MIRKEHFGNMPDGREISLYTLENDRIRASVSDLGAVLVRLFVPGRDGRKEDIVLGFDSGEEYLDNPHCIGATVLPAANRTKDASVVIDGTEYHLPVNDGKNNLHSDQTSFTTMWDVDGLDENSITFVHTRADMEDGLPGDRRFETAYTLLPDGIRIDYHVTSSRPTYINPTNHSYFNLAGNAGGSALGQTLRLYASAFTPLGEGKIPTGEIRPVGGTAFDFTTAKTIGRDIENGDPQLILGQANMPRLSIGAEVYYFNGMSDSEVISELTIDKKRGILIEMPSLPWTEAMYRELEGLYTKRGLIPIIAHLDRYLTFRHGFEIQKRLAELPVLVQVNAEFFLEWSTARKALRMLKKDGIHLLGSDCHNRSDRKPNLGSAVEVIRKNLGEHALEPIVSYEQMALEGR